MLCVQELVLFPGLPGNDNDDDDDNDNDDNDNDDNVLGTARRITGLDTPHTAPGSPTSSGL